MFGLPSKYITPSRISESIRTPAFWGTLVTVGLFIFFKFPQLDIAYFWDEAWVYAPAVQVMAQNGPSLLPDAIPVELSRGHPLLFHFLGGLWVKMFGTSFISLHSFGLTISCALLLAVYQFGRTFFSPLVGLFSTVLLALQPAFIAQANMVLPEVMLALWTVLCLYHYLKGNALGYIIFGSALVLTKETGLLLIGILGLWTFIQMLVERKQNFFTWNAIRPLLILGIPILVIFLFFMAQYTIRGWVFYPGHTDLFVKDWGIFQQKFIFFYKFLFEEQGRYLVTLIFLIAISFGKQQHKWLSNAWRILAPILAILIWLQPGFMHKGLTFSSILVLFLLVLLRLHQLAKEADFSAKPVLLIPVFILAYVAFSSANFSTLRYLMSLFPLYILLAVWGLEVVLVKHNGAFHLIALVLCASTIFHLNNLSNEHNISDCYPGYEDAVRLGEEVIQHLEEMEIYEEKLATSFLSWNYLTQPLAGYRTTEREFKRVYNYFERSATYFLIGNLEYNAEITNHLRQQKEIVRLERFERGTVWYELYQKK